MTALSKGELPGLLSFILSILRCAMHFEAVITLLRNSHLPYPVVSGARLTWGNDLMESARHMDTYRDQLPVLALMESTNCNSNMNSQHIYFKHLNQEVGVYYTVEQAGRFSQCL